uniref:RNA-dependent RNA polymerase n=1 Tax=Sclerotium rolfsii unassigned dsRNA virus 1 TaxID=2490826 RepID=A0A3G8EYL4_9VIRU|nr:RNA-dependent RNA polymerase [Sclerotium rolfsii unassigned dsRNA virus 1]
MSAASDDAQMSRWMRNVALNLKRARSYEDDLHSIDTTVPSSPASSSGTARRRNKRHRLNSQSSRTAEEDSITRALEGLEYLGRNDSGSPLHMELEYAEPCMHFRQFVEENPGLFEDTRFEDWRFVEANHLAEMNHLKRFCREYPEIQPQHEWAISRAIEVVSALMELPEKIPFPTKDQLDDVRWIGSKYPGIEYFRMGFKTRAEANPVALEHARAAYEDLMSGRRVEPQLNKMGGRGKLVKEEKIRAQGKDTTAGRLILMASQRDVLLAGLLEQPLTAALLGPEYPVSVGTSWWKGGVNDFITRFHKFERFFCLDAEKYDSSLPPWLIEIALHILRDQYEDGQDEKYDTYWDFIRDGLIYAPIYLPNGMMFRRKGGSTSGHNFNTLMQSVATLVMVYTGFFLLVGEGEADRVEEEVYAESLGDDQHTGTRGACAKYEVEDIAEVVMEVFQVSLGGDKSFATTRLFDDIEGEFQGTQYLGKFWRWFDEVVDDIHFEGYIPYRPFVETALRLYYPERGEQGELPAWQRAVGHYADAAGLTRTRAMLEQYLDWLEPRVDGQQFFWTERQLKRLGDKVNRLPPPLPARRCGFVEWLQAVLTDIPVESAN